MAEKLFFINEAQDQKITYAQLFQDLNNIKEIPKIIKINDTVYNYFKNLIASLIYQREIEVGENIEILEKEEGAVDYIIEDSERKEVNISNFQLLIKNADRWRVTLYTSGTTGIPKKIIHTLESLTRFVSLKNHENDVWLLTYSPVHIAGLQVFFQALLNFNSIVFAYRFSKEAIYRLIKEYNISHISGTTTFYRMLSNTHKKFNSVKSLTFGGEKFDSGLASQLQKIFPNAKIKNIYASTEIGSLLISQNDIYSIPERFKNKIQIQNDELYVHKSLLAESDSIEPLGEWYATGDVIEILKHDPLEFRIVGRKGDIIKIGGYRVNINEIEEILNSHPQIELSKIYSKKNSVLGNVLIANVVSNSNAITEKQIKDYLRQKLPEYKIPRIVRFVKNINITNSGKVKR